MEGEIEGNGCSTTEMNQKEACESQVVHNMQAQNMLKLQDEWQELMSYAWNLGLYCFVGMVTSNPGNVSAFGQNAIIYNDEIIGSFLKDHLDLPTLKGQFYKHVLISTNQPEAALVHKRKEKELKAKFECQNQDSIHMAVTNMLKKLISKHICGKLISRIDWKQLPWHLIKRKLSLHNCPSPDFVTMLEKGVDVYSTPQWHSLYDALGSADPDDEYAKYAQDPSSKLMDIVLWTEDQLTFDPSGNDYGNIVLVQDNSGSGDLGGAPLLFVKDVIKGGSSMRSKKRHTEPSPNDTKQSPSPSPLPKSSQKKKMHIMLLSRAVLSQ